MVMGEMQVGLGRCDCCQDECQSSVSFDQY